MKTIHTASPEQLVRVAKFLRRQGVNGGRVARLVLGVTAPEEGDYNLLMDAAFALSSRKAEQELGLCDLYLDLSAFALRFC